MKENKYFKVAVHGLIKKDGKFLVTRRSKINDYMPEFWDIPGGTIEFGEETLSALRREVKEETSLEIKPGKIFLAYGYLSGENRHQFQLVYECDYISGEVKLEPEEHDEYRWVSVTEMASLKRIAFLDQLFKELSQSRLSS